MENDRLTDELMQRASKLIQDIEAFPSQGTIYVVSRALYDERKRGREEAAKTCDTLSDRADEMAKEFPTSIYERRDCGTMSIAYLRAAAAIRSGQ
jgi:hypothetical protein